MASIAVVSKPNTSVGDLQIHYCGMWRYML